MCMFPACCFRQKTYVAQDQVTGVLNETRTKPTNMSEFESH